jgi:hypothetical protein
MNYYTSANGIEPHLWKLIPLVGASLVFLMIWSMFWKGLALWHSSQRRQPWWFVILLIVNTAGLLEIIYIFAVAKVKLSKLFSSN